MSALASLSTRDTDFYTAVATIIPVFLVAYVIQLNKMMGESVGPRFGGIILSAYQPPRGQENKAVWF